MKRLFIPHPPRQPRGEIFPSFLPSHSTGSTPCPSVKLEKQIRLMTLGKELDLQKLTSLSPSLLWSQLFAESTASDLILHALSGHNQAFTWLWWGSRPSRRGDQASKGWLLALELCLCPAELVRVQFWSSAFKSYSLACTLSIKNW